MTLTVFKAGNSNVVAIPRNLLEELDIKPGQKVVVEKSADESAILIKKVEKATSKKGAKRGKEELNKWWKSFEKENGGLLDDLA